MSQVIEEQRQGGKVNADRLRPLAKAAEAELQSAPYREIRALRCMTNGDTIHLQGRVGSYFLKQMAQEFVQQAIRGVCSLENRVEVTRPLAKRSA